MPIFAACFFMKLVFFLDQKSLSSVLALIQNICTKKTALESTSNVLFLVGDSQEVIIRATDLDISLQFSLPAKIYVAEAQSLLVNAKRLYDFVKDLSSLIKFSYDGTTLAINYGEDDALDPDFSLTLLTTDPETFPAFPERIENVINLDASFLQFALNKTAPLIPTANPNPAINCLLLDFDQSGLNLVATDGHSLAMVRNTNYSLSESKSWTLPRKSVFELKKVVDSFLSSSFSKENSGQELFFGFCKGQVVFSGPNFNFFTRLIADPFPNYKPLLDFQDFQKGQILLSALSPLLKRVGYLLSGRFIPALFSFDNNHVKVFFQNPESGSISEQISFLPLSKINLEIKFYTPYLLAVSSAFEHGDVDFFIKSSTQPIFFHQDLNGYSLTYLVMPVFAE
jgi:DNA polymerase-3 subunit beta